MVQDKLEKEMKKKKKEILDKNPKAKIDYGLLLKQTLEED